MSLGDIEITTESVHDFLSKVDITDLFDVNGKIENKVAPSDRHLENDMLNHFNSQVVETMHK